MGKADESVLLTMHRIETMTTFTLCMIAENCKQHMIAEDCMQEAISAFYKAIEKITTMTIPSSHFRYTLQVVR